MRLRPIEVVAIHSIRRQKKAEAAQLRQKALEPHKRHCYILDKEVSILVEFPDYKGPHHKGAEGAIYCENIINCYQNNVKCRYSGISPLYPDPFYPREKPPTDPEGLEAEDPEGFEGVPAEAEPIEVEDSAGQGRFLLRLTVRP